MLGKRIRVVGLLTLTASTTLTGRTPALATDYPAYGTITITGTITGFVPAWTYDPEFWRCGTDVEGLFNAPTAVTVTCINLRGVTSKLDRFVCPLMVLTTTTGGLAARAGGRATCTGSLDTGVISGVNQAQRTGNLGIARQIVCRAYGPGGIEGVLVPPYKVTCGEPGLPTL